MPHTAEERIGRGHGETEYAQKYLQGEPESAEEFIYLQVINMLRTEM